MFDQQAAANITPRDLLCHRSGLPGHDFVWANTESSITRDDVCQKIKFLQPNTNLRNRFQYQNIMYAAAGYLIEILTGKTWEQFVQNNILSRNIA